MKRENTARGEGFLALFLPVLISGLFGQLYPIVSTALISHRLDITALSAVGALAPYSVLQSALFAGLGTGVALEVSLDLNRKGAVRKAGVSSGALLIACLTLAAGALLAAVAKPLCTLMGIREALLDDCTTYLKVLLLGSGFITLKTAALQTCQNTGQTRFASVVSMAGVVLQSGISITLFFLFPGEIWYVPMSTLLTNIAVSLCLLARIRRKAPDLRGSLKIGESQSGALNSAGKMAKLGFSRSGLMLLIGVGGFFLQRSVNGLSTEVISGYSGGNVAVNLFMEPLNAIAVLATIHATKEGMTDNVRRLLQVERGLMGRAAVYCLALLLVLPFAGRPLLRFLLGEGADSPAVLAGYLRLAVTVPLFLPLAVYLSGRNILQLLRPGVLVVLGACEFLCEMAGAVLVPRVGYPAAPACIAAAWVIGAVLCLVFLRIEWKKVPSC